MNLKVILGRQSLFSRKSNTRPRKNGRLLLLNLFAVMLVLFSACTSGQTLETALPPPTGWPTFTPLAVKKLPTKADSTVTPAPLPLAKRQPVVAATSGTDPSNIPIHLILVQHAGCAWDKFWCVLENGIHDAARDMNATVTILSPDRFDMKTTALQVDEAVAARPDGIALTVSDPVMLHEAISRAIASGIPVIAYNAGAGPIKDNLSYLTYLGMDDNQAGYLAAFRLIKEGARAGVCIIHAPDLIALQNRCNGFLKAFKENGMVATILNSHMDADLAINDISQFAMAHPDVNAYLTTGPASALPFYAYLQSSARKPGEILHGTFDLGAEISTNIESGNTLFAIDQQPYLQGYAAVMWLTLIKRYGFKPASPVIATGPRFVEKGNLNPKTNTQRMEKLVLVHHGLCSWDPYWCVLDQGAYDAAKNMGIQVTIKGPPSYDLYQTAGLIDETVHDAPDGIGVSIPDPNILHASILRAIQTGFPVIAFDSGSGPLKDNLPYLTFIGQDEYESGYLGALRLINAGARAGVCAIQQKGQTALEARCQGFKDAFAKKGLKTNELDIGGDPVKALNIIKEYFQVHPEVNSVMTLNATNPGATTIYNYLKDPGRKPGELLHGTFDLSTDVVSAIENGTTLFTIDAQPYLQGYTTVMFLTLALRQGILPVSPITSTGPAFVDKSNIDIVKRQAGKTR
jgi:simple sugar transport system substrate-binding protein